LRIARKGGGRSGGYRTLVAFKAENRAFFLFGFSKSVTENITSNEASELEFAGRLLLERSMSEIEQLKDEGKIRELMREGDEEIGR